MIHIKKSGLLMIATIVTCLLATGCAMPGSKDQRQEESINTTIETQDESVNEESEESSEETDSMENDDTAKTSSEIDYSGYDDLIAKAKDIIENPSSEYPENSEFSSVIYMKSDYETLGYLIKDINGDGIDELIIGANTDGWDNGSWDGIIYNMYTLINGEVVQVLNGWERNRYYLCEDGSIANEGSNSAFESNYSYFTYNGGKLSLIESVIYNSTVDENNPWYYSRESEYDIEKAESISEEEANEIMGKYKHERLEYIPFVS